MPDRRSHRGPHPDDLRLFAAESWPGLRVAIDDLCWLLGRGYPPEAWAKLVGDHFQLFARQRTAMERCACSAAAAADRRRREVLGAQLAGRVLWIDGYNVLTTVEAALAGGVILVGRDGCYRDMASMHGSYRKVSETRPALELLGGTLSALGVSGCRWLLDRPVSNSGRLKGIMEEMAAAEGWPWQVELAASPDAELIACGEIVVTADSAILDRCCGWFNLARETLRRHVPQAFLPELGSSDRPLSTFSPFCLPAVPFTHRRIKPDLPTKSIPGPPWLRTRPVRTTRFVHARIRRSSAARRRGCPPPIMARNGRAGPCPGYAGIDHEQAGDAKQQRCEGIAQHAVRAGRVRLAPAEHEEG